MMFKYPNIKLTGTKAGKCSVCGKRAVVKETFSQTLNPWNVKPNGNEKNRDEIEIELWQKKDEWEKQPIVHRKCERSF